MDVKVVKEIFEGEWDGCSYDVLIDGKRVGTCRRDDSVPTGYYGRWAVGSAYWTDTRKDAVRYIVHRYTVDR